MMTLVATILSVLFVAAGIYVMVRDFYNIGAALASGITASGVKADKKATSVDMHTLQDSRWLKIKDRHA